jgi:hypothetical protein
MSALIPIEDYATLAPTSCLDKRGLARFLTVSVRTLDRADAMGLLPPADLIVGNSRRRWSPDTISKWLRTHPRLPGRKGVKP